MKVLITGGAGYLGSNLTRHLLEAGYSVTVLDNLMYDQVTLLHLFGNPKFQFELGDVRDKKLLQELVGLNDVIIPLAAIVGMPACKANPELTVALNFLILFQGMKLQELFNGSFQNLRLKNVPMVKRLVT